MATIEQMASRTQRMAFVVRDAETGEEGRASVELTGFPAIVTWEPVGPVPSLTVTLRMPDGEWTCRLSALERAVSWLRAKRDICQWLECTSPSVLVVPRGEYKALHLCKAHAEASEGL